MEKTQITLDHLLNTTDNSFLRVFEYAKKKGVLKATINEGPSSSFDVTGYWSPSFSFKGLGLWLLAIYEWLSTALQIAREGRGFFSAYALKSNFEFLKNTHPFHLPWSGWIWTISSLEFDKVEFLENKAYKILEKKHQKKELNRRKPDVKKKYEVEANKEIEKLKQDFSLLSEEFELYLKEKGLVRIGNLYINTYDPTVFYVDIIYCPYDNARGWNKEGIKKALQLWLHEAGISIPVEVTENNP